MINTYRELFIQYLNAMGKKVNLTSATGREELEKEMENFSKWLYEHATDTMKYGGYLRNVMEGFERKPALELNKGFYDTLSRTCKNVEVIPTYSYSMDLEGKTLMFDYDKDHKMVTPCVYKSGRIRNLNLLDYELLVSHNPYSYDVDDVHKTLSLIHRQGNFAVSFGVFGKETDADKDKKIEILRKFADSLEDEYKISYESEKGLYFASANSKRKIKELIKTR